MDHILIIRFSSLGDIILATSVIDAVRRLWPDCRITFVVKEEYAPVLEGNPWLGMVIPMAAEARGLGSLLKLGGDLKRHGVDLVLDLQGGLRGRTLSAATGAPRKARIKSRRWARMLMVARPSRWRVELPHVVERYLECVGRWTNEQVLSDGPCVWVSEGEKAKARAMLGSTGSRRLVALAPGAKWRAKRWPERYYAGLADVLSADGFGVLVLGSAEERPLLDRIVSPVAEPDSVMAMSGGLRELAALFCLCEAAVCNDSGLMHLAGAVGTRSVGLFGPTAPHLGFTPHGEGHRALWLGLECSPCSLHGDKPCRIAEKAPCLEELEPAKVLGVLRPMLQAAVKR
jgi:heptosyltransferase-2